MLRKLSGDKFSRDVLWNIGSLGVAGVCGVAVNFLVGMTYGANALGVFNQVFAVYLVFAQLAALGVHISVLTYGAAEKDPDSQRAIATSGLVLTFVQSILMVALFLALARPIGRLLDSPDVGTGIPFAAPGLVCFALNKVALSVLNARRRMVWYALFQAGRVVLMGVGFGACVLLDAKATTLPVMLSVGEGAILIGALITIRDQLGALPRATLQRWAGIHWRFGLRGFLSGLFSEINTRIDVFILGVFASDSIVGAYSLASLIAEGMFQLLIALRTNYAPILVGLLAQRQQDKLVSVIAKGVRRTYVGALAVAVLAVGMYSVLLPVVTSDPLLLASRVYFAILLCGMVCSAGYAPFNQLLLWANRPGSHTIMIALIVAVGATANAALGSMFGATGASMATAATYVWSTIALRWFVRRVLDLRI